MRSTGGPGWPPGACAEHGLRSAMLREKLSALLLSCIAQKAGGLPILGKPPGLIARIPRDRRATVPLATTSLHKPQFSQGHVGATAVEKDRQPRPKPEWRN